MKFLLDEKNQHVRGVSSFFQYLNNSELGFHLVKKDKRIFDIVDKDTDNKLTYDDLEKIYPSGIKEGELMQIAHDMIEFRLDLRQEPIIGKITPNYFLAQLEKNGILAAAMEKLNSLPDRPVSFHELLTSIQKVYLEVGKHYRAQSLTISYIAWAINSLTWQYERMVGFFTEKPWHYFSPLCFEYRRKILP